MSSPSRENLLGYLLGALERSEHEQVELELAQNPAFRDELVRLESSIGRVGLLERPPHISPRPGLAERTCSAIALQTRPAVSLRRHESHYEPRRYTWADMAVTAAVVLMAAALFFPAVSHSRFQADIAMCQNRLRQLGMAMHEYSSRQPDRSFPRIEAEGKRGVAGAYAPTLVSNRLVNDPQTFVCPSRPGEPVPVLPTMEALDLAEGAELVALQRTIGGHYGYNMGYKTADGVLVPPRDARRSQYVLLADAPSDRQPGRRTANHDGRGQNVLYEDGRVRFIINIPCAELPDDPFHNREGRVAAGLDRDDAVLGASADRPIPATIFSLPR